MTFDAVRHQAATRCEQANLRNEIEQALSRYDTADGFVGPCELVVAGATR